MKTDDQNLPLTPLIALVHHRWNIPVLAELERQSGGRFVTLANNLGASRSSLSRSLGDLMDMGLVVKNPGVGHPMRPEYLLTSRGREIGSQCVSLVRLLNRRGENDIAYRKWTLPLVAALGSRVRRFNELRDALGDRATPRAVALGLRAMTEQRWATRSLIDEYPPAAGYQLMPKGRSVLERIREFY